MTKYHAETDYTSLPFFEKTPKSSTVQRWIASISKSFTFQTKRHSNYGGCVRRIRGNLFSHLIVHL